MKNKLLVIIGIAILITGAVLAMQEKKEEKMIINDEIQVPEDIVKPAPQEPDKTVPSLVVSTNDCSGVTPAVDKLLKANSTSIDISHPGYSYSVAEHVTEKVFDGMLDRVVLDVCYNNRLILTRDLRMSFINGKFRSAFDFDFVTINVNSNPKISLADAKKIAYREQSALSGVEPKLGYYDLHATQGQVAPEYILAWEFRKGAHVVIDAHTGQVVRSFDGIMY